MSLRAMHRLQRAPARAPGLDPKKERAAESIISPIGLVEPPGCVALCVAWQGSLAQDAAAVRRVVRYPYPFILSLH